MLQTNTRESFIIKQQLYRRYNTLRILKGIVAGIITALILYAIVAIIYNIPYSIVPPIIIGLGVILFVFSILSNIERTSPSKVGAANRYEFYSVTALLIGFLFALNLRIDSIFEILMTMK